MRRPSLVRLLGLSLTASLLAFGAALALPPAESQDRSSGRRSEASAPEGEAEPDAPAGADDDVDVDSTFSSAGGEKVKVMEFTGLDVSGRLKSPQLLYFLNRLRAEFDRPRLPHRSFVGEMERSTHEKSF